MAGLRSAEGYIRRQLARNMNLRNTPEITFLLDESIEYGVNMAKLIDDVTGKDTDSGTHIGNMAVLPFPVPLFCFAEI